MLESGFVQRCHMSEERSEILDLDDLRVAELDEKGCTIATRGILFAIVVLLLICLRAIASN
ncbi:MAG: hypothetical protein QG621_459 [Patescibacteria group bacterium]|nr:hypothetical protein [Patescibacteria group bacterium]